MKLTKRIAAIAATAVMAITSAVGMSASAIEISDCTNSVCSEQPRLLPTLLPGKYTHSTGTGYIEISNDGNGTDRYIQGIVSGTFSNKITTNYGEVYTKK